MRATRQLGYTRARYPRPLGSRPRFYLAVCAIFRNEADYLAEWITFHRLRGVERFWLYDNLSEDNWRSALTPEIDAGIVTVTPWPHQPGQISAYADCLERHRDEARWIAFVDVDEFLFSPTGRSLPDVLRGFDMHPGVVVNWRMYGLNGYAEAPPGLVTENYLMRGGDAHEDNRHVKSIVYPRSAILRASPHNFDYRGVAVGEDLRPQWSHQREPPTAALLRINHYYAKSASHWERKRARPTAFDGMIRETALVPADEVRDETILQFVPGLRDALADRATGVT
jgi:hypothetical protein